CPVELPSRRRNASLSLAFPVAGFRCAALRSIRRASILPPCVLAPCESQKGGRSSVLPSQTFRSCSTSHRCPLAFRDWDARFRGGLIRIGRARPESHAPKRHPAT